ncbi:hypothetical protein PENTCL1PPCAC_19997, partial [Pristionchus entomophagus]
RDVIVIDDDDSANEHPAKKNAKIMEESFHLITGTAELRTEATKTRHHSKHGFKEDYHAEKKRADDLEKSVAEMSSQLE